MSTPHSGRLSGRRIGRLLLGAVLIGSAGVVPFSQPADAAPVLGITKTAASSTVAATYKGATLSWTIQYKCTSLTEQCVNASVTDSLPAGLTLTSGALVTSLGDLAAGTTGEFTITARADCDTATRSFNNQATFRATGAAARSASSNVTVTGAATCDPPPPPPFKKEGPSLFNPGGRPRFTITLPAESGAYVAEDVFPAGTVFDAVEVAAPVVAEVDCGSGWVTPSSCTPASSATKIRFLVPAASSPAWRSNPDFNFTKATLALRVPIGTPTGGTISNTASVTSGVGAGTVSSTSPVGNVVGPAPMAQIAKWIDRVPGTKLPSWLAGYGTTSSDDVVYALYFDNDFNAGAAGGDLVDPVITDLLDADTMWVPGQNWWAVTSGPTGCTSPTFTTVSNFNGTGRTLLRWTFTGCTILAAQASPPNAQIRFTARMVPGTTATTDVTNDATVSTNGAAAIIACGPNETTDAADVDADSNTTEKRCDTSASFALPKLALFDSSKWVNGAAEAATTWSRYPTVAETTVDSGGFTSYRVFLKSIANIDSDVIELFDILPFSGDTAVSEPGLTRDSEWGHKLVAPIEVDLLGHAAWDDAKTVNEQTGFVATPATVQYSKSTNPCRFDSSQQLKFTGTLPSGCIDDWSSDFVGARAFRVRVDTNLTRYMAASKSGDVLRLRFKAVDEGVAADHVNKIAWNSFGYTVTDTSGSEALTAEPIKVGVKMTAAANLQPSIGDTVWYDENNDGVQDSWEEGIAGVTVTLMSACDGSGSVVQSVVTTATGTYRFDGLTAGATYCVRLDRASDFTAGGPLDGFTLSPTDAAPGGTNDDTKDSDATQPTGGRPTIASAPAGTGGTHTPTYDFGFWKEPLYSIGNRVWLDDDSSGGITNSEAGVDSVKVNLLKKQSGGTYTAAGTDTTAGGGYYRFDGLTAGHYKVVIDSSNFGAGKALQGRRSTTGPAAKDDPNTDVDLDDNGLQPASIGDYTSVGVSSGVVTLGPGKSETAGETDLSGSGQGAEDKRANMTVDFGFVTPKFAVGNYVWIDADRDANQDAGETGINGLTVRLCDSNGTELASTVTANGPDGRAGYYLFDNLLAGSYSMCFTDIPNGYVLTAANVVTSTASLDSDPNPVTGRTLRFTLDETLPVVTSVDGPGVAAGYVLRDIDAGIYPVFSLGNTVWHDRNGNSRIDSGEPGMDGVVVGVHAADASGQPTGPAIATRTTANGGQYLFTGLVAGEYVVVIGSSQFAPGAALAPFVSSGTSSQNEAVAASAENSVDGDDNGTRVIGGAFANSVVSSKIVLGPTASEPTGETATVGITDPTPDDQSNLTVDFGFVTMSVGNLVWVDTDNSGTKNGTESGLAGVPVRIYRDDNGDGEPDGNELASTTTGSSTGSLGQYLFTGLAPGRYVTEIVAPAGYMSSTGTASSTTGPFEPGKGDDAGVDSNDHGTTRGNVIRSSTILLAPASEPGASVESDGLDASFTNPAVDSNTDLTVDFGLVPAATLGNYVWLDNNRNGLQDDAVDAGINGVTVRLLSATDTVIRTTVTSVGPDGKPGYYRFDVLPGSYRVVFDLDTLPEGFVVTTPNQGTNDAADSDGDRRTGRTDLTELTAGENDPTWDLGVWPTASVVGNQVWLDVNANGINDDGPASGVPGVKVTLHRCASDGSLTGLVTTDIQGNAYDAQRTTDAGGFYLFENLRPGRYCVVFVPPTGFSPTRSNVGSNDTVDSNGLTAVSTSLKGGQSDLTLDLGLVRPVSVGDRIFFDGNRNGIQDGADIGLPGVGVSIEDARTGTPVTVDVYGRPVVDQISDGTGLYLFKDLAPGKYRVKIVSTPPNVTPTVVGAGGDRTSDSQTGSDTTVDLLGGDEDRSLDFGFIAVDVVPVITAPPATPKVEQPLVLVAPSTPPVAPAPTPAPTVPVVVQPAPSALALDGDTNRRGVLGENQLAFTGADRVESAVRIGVAMVGLGLALAGVGRRRRRAAARR